MHQILVLFARLLAPALGVLLGLLGFATRGENLLGWLLFLGGVLYTAGIIIAAYVWRSDAGESGAAGMGTGERASELSSWLLTAGMIAAFILPPLEFLYLHAKGLTMSWLELAGAILACAGGVVIAWAQRGLAASYEGHRSAAQEGTIKEHGLYRFVRYPTYLGYLLAALGLAVGYYSRWGAAALLLLLLPAVLWRVRMEDNLLAARFGKQFHSYASRTKRVLPGVW